MGADRKQTLLSAARLALASKRARVEAGSAARLMQAEPLAIVGMGCRLPGGADTPEKYWELLEAGGSGIRPMPEDRWTASRAALPPHLVLGGYLDGADQFDAEFFGIAPREAASIDPQQRLLLEVCWEALADAGMAPSSLAASETGVFLAVYNSDYLRLQLEDGARMDAQTGVGAAHSVAAGRLSFLLNLRGPSLAVDTACSSSLVAAHLACQSLRQRECSLAMVAGVSLKLLPDEVRAFAQWGMLAKDGRVKAFDADADGFVPGEGCGVVLLKRLSEAIADGNRIRGVIRGSAVNHDGRSSVLTAPNGPAQEAVMRKALVDAQIEAGDVSFVETHGTGTSLGDPIEMEALDAVYGAGGAVAEKCTLGAVKTNFGHLEAAAGMAGLIKVALALEHGKVPGNLHFQRMNPQIRLGPESRLVLANGSADWPRTAGQARFAAVSSFGLSGTNAHIVLEEAPVLPQSPERAHDAGQDAFCLPISAHTLEGLRTVAGGYLALLNRADTDFGRLARAAARNRDHADFRVAVTAASREEAHQRLAKKLEEIQERMKQAAASAGEAMEGPQMIAFVFSGQGSLWTGMLEGLLVFPQAQVVLEECERLVSEIAGWSLRQASNDMGQLQDTAKAQPLLFATQVALVRVLESWGIRPAAVTGHSVGEVAAAVCAGALTLAQGLRLVVARGARMAGAAGRGRMLAAEMSVREAEGVLAEQPLSVEGVPELAVVNAPRSVVFSGAAEAVKRLARDLAARGIEARPVDVMFAFHSRWMEGARIGFEEDVRMMFGPAFEPARPKIPLVSTVTGTVWRPGVDGSAEYWGQGVRRPVLFAKAIEGVVHLGCRSLIEIGPHPVLLRAMAAVAEGQKGEPAVTCTAAMRRGQSARTTLPKLAAVLYSSGQALDWAAMYPGPPAHAALPAYPWQRKRYWLPERERAAADGSEGGCAWPGREIVSPFVEGRLWEAKLSLATDPWLRDHRWRGKALMPFAAWLQLARLAAEGGRDRRSNAGLVVTEFSVQQRLSIHETETVAWQTHAAPGGEIRVAAASASDGRMDWQTCASGSWRLEAAPSPGMLDLQALAQQCTRQIEPGDLYASLSARGLDYGPAFRLLTRLQAGAGAALGFAALPAGSTRGWCPELLDACLQVLAAAEEDGGKLGAMLPMSVRSYQVYEEASDVIAFATLRKLSAADAEGDVVIARPDGRVVVELKGLRVRRVTQAASMHQVRWVRMDEAGASGPRPLWSWRLACGEGGGVGAARRLLPLLDTEGNRERPAQERAVLVAGTCVEAAEQLIALAAEDEVRPGGLARVAVLTRGALAVHAGESVDPDQAALLGLVRSIRAEYPGWLVQSIDVQKGDAAEHASLLLHAEDAQGRSLAAWLGGGSEDLLETAWRQGAFWRPELVNWPLEPARDDDSVLMVGTPGLLATLYEEPCTVPDPGPGEVQIMVRAHGLNFRDVLTAAGTYAGQAAPLGAECSGIVQKAGSGVSGLTPGMAVVAFAPASLRSTVNVPAAYVLEKPAGLSFPEAATMPVAFLTAWYAFFRLAGLAPGQSVLVHSAAGGLGQAAVQLARYAGARVLATAGSEEKRAYLRAWGVADVFDSRSDRFAEEVLAATGGEGVDVILNSLSGGRIAAGFRALQTGGAFLEVGKREIWTPEQAHAHRPDARYRVFDLGEVAQREPETIEAMMAAIFALLREGKLTPLPAEIYEMAEAQQAFRMMASGRHIGKLVLVRPASRLLEEEWKPALETGTVLVTGGFGGLGLATAGWLLEEGARSLVLVGRNAAAAGAQELKKKAAEKGASLALVTADVCSREAMRAVLAEIAGERPALRIVIHAAGEVEDRLFRGLSGASLVKGMRVKVEGARLLAELTGGQNLLVTLYYSSLAALLGSPGQASYAAANAFLDGLADERSARGQRTLSVNWGAWSAETGGMFAQMTTSARSRAEGQGMRPLRAEAALEALRQAVLSGASRVVIADMDWAVYRAHMGASSIHLQRFLAGFLPGSPVSAVKDEAPSHAKLALIAAETIAGIRQSPKLERKSRMEAYVREEARKVLGLSAARPIASERPLQELGLDSLMALELRNVLAQTLGRTLSSTLLFDYPTVRTLAAHLLPFVTNDETYYSGTVKSSASASELESISEAEAEELLLAELDGRGRG